MRAPPRLMLTGPSQLRHNSPLPPQKSGVSLLERARAAYAVVSGEDAPAALKVKEILEACEEDLGLGGEGGMKARIEVLEQNL